MYVIKANGSVSKILIIMNHLSHKYFFTIAGILHNLFEISSIKKVLKSLMKGIIFVYFNTKNVYEIGVASTTAVT